MKKAVIVVSNDLATDQRVHRHAITLVESGYEVLLVGAQKKGSLPLDARDYPLRRLPLIFSKSALFYAEFNIRLFLYLLFRRSNLIVSNDLDTLPAAYLAHRIKGCHLVYDSHEYFTGVPELENRPFPLKVWKFFEKLIIPNLKHAITVNESIAGLYMQEYGVRFIPVRNIPASFKQSQLPGRKELGLPLDKKIIILQGSGINIHRGAEEAVSAMQFLDGFLLLIIGGGDVIPQLKKMVTTMSLQDKVRFIPRIPRDQLIQYTCNSDIGLTLDKDTNINYRFSLPNKLFDYIQAGIPVLASPLPEIRKIIEDFDIGMLIANHEPNHIASRLKEMISDPSRLVRWKENLKLAAGELCWEKEQEILKDVYKSL